MNRRLTAALLVAAAVLTNVAFTALGTVFNYPDVLKEPVAEVLAAFRASQAAVTGWFAVMAISAALFARFLSRQDDSPTMKAVAALRNQFGGHAVKRVSESG